MNEVKAYNVKTKTGLINQGKKLIDGYNKATERYYALEKEINIARYRGLLGKVCTLEAAQRKCVERQDKYSSKIQELGDTLTEPEKQCLISYYGIGDLFN